jgi:putative FmdB family regulatory protein
MGGNGRSRGRAKIGGIIAGKFKQGIGKIGRGAPVPLYEYVCKKCGKRSERVEKMDGPRMRKCPKCGGTVEQVLSAPAIQFKGSGWYVTDYAKKSGSVEAGKTAAADSAKAGAAESGKAEGKEKKETKSESGAAEKSSEKSTEKRGKAAEKEK